MDYYNIEFLLWLDSLSLEQSEQDAANEANLIGEFGRRFPIHRLRDLQMEDYRPDRARNESFCTWVSSISQPLSGGLFRLANKCYGFNDGIARKNWLNRRNVHGYDPSEEGILKEEVLFPLAEFIETKGEKCCSELKSIFPVSILLNVLYLYWPDEFLPILSEKWLDKIIWQFSLGQGEQLAYKAHVIADFYKRVENKHRIYPLGFVRLIDAYMGLSKWGDDNFGKYLLATGLDTDSAEKCRRTLRMWYGFKNNFTEKPSKYSKELNKASFIAELSQYTESHPTKSLLGFDVRFGKTTALKLLADFQALPNEQRYKGRSSINVYALKRFADIKDVSGLVQRLCEYGENHDSYMHYTTLTGLLHIVGGDANQKLTSVFCLTRGDDEHMNDQLEWTRLGQEKIWRRTYLMCFQADENECAAMWGLYGKPDNEAVRIMFPRKVFTDWLEKVRNGNEKVYCYVEDNLQGDVVVLPIGSYDICLADVIYGGNVTGEKPIDKPRYVIGGSNISISKEIDGLERSAEITGYIKSIDWSYEKETRIIVKIKDDYIAGKLSNAKHLFIGCESLQFELLTYMFGPCVPPKLYEVYEQTLKNRIPGLAREYVKKSNYTGYLKFK